jgi:hypothetical protein
LNKIKPFSYDEYKYILDSIKDRLFNFRNIHSNKFILLRHDVEFNIFRAHEIAKIEFERNVSSTFFFQVRSPAYNPFSIDNKLLINKIKTYGHDIGLHFYVSNINADDKISLINELRTQKELFEKGLGLKCSIFSFHRPPEWVLKIRDNRICEMINVYGDSFFEFSSSPKKIKYIADSMHKWNYGHPVDNLHYEKIQILLHPDEWSSEGSTEKQLFHDLIEEQKKSFVNTLDNETKHFNKYKKDFQ